MPEEASQPAPEGPPKLAGAAAGPPPALGGLGLAAHWEGSRGKAEEREDGQQGAERLREAVHPLRAKATRVPCSPGQSSPLGPPPLRPGPSPLRWEGSTLSRGSLCPSQLQVL